ncbi:glycerol acyltransferase, partial [Psychrobacter sp. 1Y4]
MMSVTSLYYTVMIPKIFKRSKSDAAPSARSKILPNLSREQVGDNVPRRGNKVSPIIGSWLMKTAGWRTVGEIPNISQAV